MNPATPPARWPVHLEGKPDFERCMDRVDAWFQQQVLDRPPIRFYKHNAQYEAGEPLDRSRWPTLEARWFDVEYQLESFEQSLAGQSFHAETFPEFGLHICANATVHQDGMPAVDRQ